MSSTSPSPISSPPSSSSPQLYLFPDARWLGGNHDGYPLLSFRQYFDARKAQSGDQAALWQSFLIFGVLEDVARVKIPEDALTRTTTTGQNRFRVVFDGNLGSILRNWRIRIRRQTRESGEEWFKSVAQTLKEAYVFVEAATFKGIFRSSSPTANPDVASCIILQIACLLEAIYFSALSFYEIDGLQTSGTRLSVPSFGFVVPNALKQGMVRRGWCPFLLSIISSSPSVISWADSQSSWVRNSLQDHAHCVRRECTINNMDIGKYQTKHLHTDCNCQWVKPSSEEIVQTLSGGGVPVVQFTDVGQLRVVPSSSAPYVAISHVWADGLGSTAEDGLPNCQVVRLAEMVRSLVPGGAFWMDSLCVPDEREPRKIAIGLMAHTYRDAAVVLVLDSCIRSIPSSAPRPLKLLRVAGSGWMQRLWTLQEAMLAQKLLFEFADGPDSVTNVLPVSPEEYHHPVTFNLAKEIFRLTKYRTRKSEFRLYDVFVALQWRTTSRASDETLAIAGLLDVDAYALASLPHQDRLRTLFLHLRTLPINIPFLYGPKLDTPGFRWAPSTLMHHSSATVNGNSIYAICTPEGLEARYFALLIPEMELRSEQRVWYIQVKHSTVYEVAYTRDTEPLAWRCNILLVPDRPIGATGCIGALTHGDRLEDTPAGSSQKFRVLCTYNCPLMTTMLGGIKDVPSTSVLIPATSGFVYVLLD